MMIRHSGLVLCAHPVYTLSGQYRVYAIKKIFFVTQRSLRHGRCGELPLQEMFAAGVISRGTRGNAVPVVKEFENAYGRHCEPFSGQKRTTLQDFAYNLNL